MSRETPHERQHTEPAGESMPPILIVVCGGAVLVFLFLVLAIPLGRLWSGVLVTVFGLAAWSVWQREAIARWNARRRARSEARRAERAAAQAAAAQAAAETAGNEKAGASVGSAHDTPEIALHPPAELVVAAMVAVPAPPAPAPPVPIPEETPARDEVDPLTAGLAEPLRPFLLAAMSRAEWSRHDLETEARRLEVSLSDALREIDAWSRKRFQEPVLVEDGSQIRVQLPLI